MSLDENQTVFSKKLRKEREMLGLMQKQMAEKLNLPPNTYNGYETGKRSPNLEVTKYIADELNVSVDYLLGRTDERNPKPKLYDGIKTIAAHRININENLPDDAIEKINDYIKMVEMMYKNNK